MQPRATPHKGAPVFTPARPRGPFHVCREYGEFQHGEWRGKAGGYALQGYGEVYVRHIAGSYSNVVGLPLAETRVLLKSAGYDIA